MARCHFIYNFILDNLHLILMSMFYLLYLTFKIYICWFPFRSVKFPLTYCVQIAMLHFTNVNNWTDLLIYLIFREKWMSYWWPEEYGNCKNTSEVMDNICLQNFVLTPQWGCRSSRQACCVKIIGKITQHHLKNYREFIVFD